VSPAKDGNPPAGEAAGAPPGFRHRLLSCLREGSLRALRQAAWLLAIMVPVSLAVALLGWSGWLTRAARPLGPAFALVGLPPESSLAFLTGVLLNLYSGIAALGGMALDARQLTVFALAALVSHNFLIELPLQRRMGVPVWRMSLLRLGASAVGAAALALVMPEADGPAGAAAAGPGAPAAAGDFWPMLGTWALGAAWLCGKVLVLVSALMILQRFIVEFGLAPRLARMLAPLMWALGLPRNCAFLWIAANTLGLAYGSAVFIEEIEKGRLGRRDATLLNCSVGLCHSLLEDTLLFVWIGAWAPWITVPRLLLAALTVWSIRAWRRLRPAGADREAVAGN
jgi:spore maturation protein SpmB